MKIELNTGQIAELEPTGHKVIIRAITAEQALGASRIVLSDEVRIRNMKTIARGEIVQLGPDAFNQAYCDFHCCSTPIFKLGDQVLFTPASAHAVPNTDVSYFIVNDEQIIHKMRLLEDEKC